MDELWRDQAHIASATFAFSHPSNFSVNHPVKPRTEDLSAQETGAHIAGYALSNQRLCLFWARVISWTSRMLDPWMWLSSDTWDSGDKEVRLGHEAPL